MIFSATWNWDFFDEAADGFMQEKSFHVPESRDFLSGLTQESDRPLNMVGGGTFGNADRDI